MNSEELHAKAELRFRKVQQAATDQAQSVADYVAVGEKRRILSSKLKTLRLAREVEELAAASVLPPKKRPVRKKPKT